MIRRPPLGETAHDGFSEYWVIDDLRRNDIPLPDTLLAYEDQKVMSSDFYVLARVEGTSCAGARCPSGGIWRATPAT